MSVPGRSVDPEISNLDEFQRRWMENVQKALTEEEPWPDFAPTTSGNPINLGPRIPSAATMTQNMIAGVQNNAQKWLDNSLNPTKDPKAAAVAAAGKWEARTQEAIQQHRFGTAVAAYDQDAAMETLRASGTAAYTSGVANRRAKIQGKMDKLQPLLQAHVRTMDSMPSSTSAEAETKMIANLRGMKAIGVILKGGQAPR